MRTTIDIEDDVLMAAKAIARHRRVSIGKVLSELVRQALAPKPGTTSRDGVPVFPIQPGAGPVSLELVNQLRDELP